MTNTTIDATPPAIATGDPSPSTPTGRIRKLNGFALFSVLAALLLTLLLEALDQTVVGTALPRIVAQLHGFDRYTWAVISYTLASTTVVPITGTLSDQFGRKWFVIGGVLLFLLGSALCGAAQTMNALIAFRALQGLGAGIGIGLSFTLVADIFPPEERAKWVGLFGAVYGLSNLIGPTLGGWLTDHGPLLGSLVTDQTRWRWVFYVNLPLGVLALIGLFFYLPTTISLRSSAYRGWAAVRRIDIGGAILAAAATTCLVLGLTWGSDGTYDWASVQVIGALVAAVVLLVAFLLFERRVVEPIIPLDLFNNRIFAPAAALTLLPLMALIGLVIYLPLYLQGVLGESATNSGALITPLTVSAVVGAIGGSALLAVRKRYKSIIIGGAILLTVGSALLTRLTPDSSLLYAAIAMVITGLGMGPFFSVITLVAQNALPPTRLGTGTSALRYLGQLGAVLGVAFVGTVVTHVMADDSARRLSAQAVRLLTPAGVKAVTNPQVLVSTDSRAKVVQQVDGFTRQAIIAHVPAGPGRDAAITRAVATTNHVLNGVFADLKPSLATAIQNGFVVVVIFCLLTLGATFFLKDAAMGEVPPAPEATQA